MGMSFSALKGAKSLVRSSASGVATRGKARWLSTVARP